MENTRARHRYRIKLSSSTGIHIMYDNALSLVKPRPVKPLVLVEEINHRVFNDYSQAIASIRLAAKNHISVEVREALASAALRLHLYADAHRAHQAPSGPNGTDLAIYLEALCVAITAARLEDRGVQLTFAAQPMILPADRCWLVALIVSELITNAARHGLCGGSGNIRVELELDRAWVSCRVIDDGLAPKNPKPGKGMDIVSDLASALGGQAAWRFGAPGAIAELTFPLHLEIEKTTRNLSESPGMEARQIGSPPSTNGNAS
jgi:two-component sensor histidine kinase